MVRLLHVGSLFTCVSESEAYVTVDLQAQRVYASLGSFSSIHSSMCPPQKNLCLATLSYDWNVVV